MNNIGDSKRLQKQDILTCLQAHQTRLHELGVRRVGLFGSFAREEQNDESDIDLLVEFDPAQKNFDNFMSLSFFLEDMLGHRIEIVTPEALSPYLRPHILKEIEYVPLAA